MTAVCDRLCLLLLQWLGEVDLRLRMEGRLMLVRLMCKDVGVGVGGQNQTIFTRCVAFRVAGTPGECSLGQIRHELLGKLGECLRSFVIDPSSDILILQLHLVIRDVRI